VEASRRSAAKRGRSGTRDAIGGEQPGEPRRHRGLHRRRRHRRGRRRNPERARGSGGEGSGRARAGSRRGSVGSRRRERECSTSQKRQDAGRYATTSRSAAAAAAPPRPIATARAGGEAVGARVRAEIGARRGPTDAGETRRPHLGGTHPTAKKTKIAPRRSDYSTRARESAARLKGLTGLPRRALGSPSRASVPAETRCPRARAPCAMAREIVRVPGSQSTASRADVAREQREKSRFKRLAKGSRPR